MNATPQAEALTWIKPEHINAERARADVARLEQALQDMRGTGGRQRERIEVWLAGARVALAIAEREGQ
jgi:hypothetical protein